MGRGVPKWVEWGGGWGGVTSQPRLHLLIRYSSQHGAGVTIKPKEATAGGGRGRWEVGEGGGVEGDIIKRTATRHINRKPNND